MKLVFLNTGDYLEFEPSTTKLVESWLTYAFDNNCNKWSIGNNSCSKIEQDLVYINEAIKLANDFAAAKIKDFERFPEVTEYDQDQLNNIHKKWVDVTDKNPNALYPKPQFWHDVNELVHSLEGSYYINFKNTKVEKNIVPDWLKYYSAEGCEYVNAELTISYRNLGRHQYNQWLCGSDVDNETNNYISMSMDFEYRYSLEFNPHGLSSTEPLGYREWCERNNVPVLPPWIQLGRFKKYDRFEVRKIIHNNLKKNQHVGILDA